MAPPIATRQRRPKGLGSGGFLLFMAGFSTLGLTVVAIVMVVSGSSVLSELITWSGHDSGYTWPLGILMIALAPVSLISGFRVMWDGPSRRSALLASLGWLVINGLFALESGVPFAMSFWILPVPFMLWGTLVEARRMGFRAALAA
jgi:uncharacterized BrkB/YihY/UPF0761 family membrane protein